MYLGPGHQHAGMFLAQAVQKLVVTALQRTQGTGRGWSGNTPKMDAAELGHCELNLPKLPAGTSWRLHAASIFI